MIQNDLLSDFLNNSYDKKIKKEKGLQKLIPFNQVEAGESVDTALARELAEELGVSVEASEQFMTLEHDYADKQVLLHVYRVTRWQGEPRGLEGQPLAWQLPAELSSWPFPAANAPILAGLLEG